MEIETAKGEEISEKSCIWKITLVASIAAGIQFGWALQLSLLTPYVQLLGIPHKWAPYIWLCGPVSGMLVQPTVGYFSDRCKSSFGRRRPFIAAGALLVAIAVFLIGYAADFGHKFGDKLNQEVKTKAIVVFVIGFWVLDVANNMLQGPCRAFLADLSGNDQSRTRMANALFSFFMAVGNVLGYSAGSYSNLYKMFPFTKTLACDLYCANLKSCFFLSIALLLILTSIALSLVKEPENAKLESESSEALCGGILTALGGLKKPMLILLLVTALNWIAWFPFLLFDTDWMGKEVYGGEVGKGVMYDRGVRAGALGLMINLVVLGASSLAIEFVGRGIGGVHRLWGGVNFLLALCLGLTVLITKLAESARHDAPSIYGGGANPPAGVKAGALTIFAVLGIPLSRAMTHGALNAFFAYFTSFTRADALSIPFAMASIYSNSSGAGQGLSLGVLNLAIVIPQMIVSVSSGPLDALFGGGNMPAFIVAAVVAAISGVLALTMLPSPPADAKITTIAPGGH